jgi:hypothetical protein
MSSIVITKVPEISGVDKAVLEQMVGLQVTLSGLPTIGWVGDNISPKGFSRYEGSQLALFSFNCGYIVSRGGLRLACTQSNARLFLRSWLKSENGNHVPDYFLIDHEFAELVP